MDWSVSLLARLSVHTLCVLIRHDRSLPQEKVDPLLKLAGYSCVLGECFGGMPKGGAGSLSVGYFYNQAYTCWLKIPMHSSHKNMSAFMCHQCVEDLYLILDFKAVLLLRARPMENANLRPMTSMVQLSRNVLLM